MGVYVGINSSRLPRISLGLALTSRVPGNPSCPGKLGHSVTWIYSRRFARLGRPHHQAVPPWMGRADELGGEDGLGPSWSQSEDGCRWKGQQPKGQGAGWTRSVGPWGDEQDF